MEEDACGLKVALCNMPSDHYKTSRECSMTGKSNVSFCVKHFAQQLLLPSLSESFIAILILGLMWSVFGRSLVFRVFNSGVLGIYHVFPSLLSM
jgi:hypothetical protein